MTATHVAKAIERVRKVIGSGVANHEIQTRYYIVDPVITGLGWNTSDPDQIRYEYPSRNEGGVDYAFFNPLRQAVIMMEAKSWRKNSRHYWPQLIGYLRKASARGESPTVGVLTDGRNWHLYELPVLDLRKIAPFVSIDISVGDPYDQAQKLYEGIGKHRWW